MKYSRPIPYLFCNFLLFISSFILFYCARIYLFSLFNVPCKGGFDRQTAAAGSGDVSMFPQLYIFTIVGTYSCGAVELW